MTIITIIFDDSYLKNVQRSDPYDKWPFYQADGQIKITNLEIFTLNGGRVFTIWMNFLMSQSVSMSNLLNMFSFLYEVTRSSS